MPSTLPNWVMSIILSGEECLQCDRSALGEVRSCTAASAACPPADQPCELNSDTSLIPAPGRKQGKHRAAQSSRESPIQLNELKKTTSGPLTAILRTTPPLSPPPYPSTFGAVKMLSRFAPRALAAPTRYAPARKAFSPAVVRRSVTTDAASSHAEKSDVPSVKMTHRLEIGRPEPPGT